MENEAFCAWKVYCEEMACFKRLLLHIPGLILNVIVSSNFFSLSSVYANISSNNHWTLKFNGHISGWSISYPHVIRKIPCNARFEYQRKLIVLWCIVPVYFGLLFHCVTWFWFLVLVIVAFARKNGAVKKIEIAQLRWWNKIEMDLFWYKTMDKYTIVIET